MQFSLVPLARIEREWPVFAESLAPAVRRNPNASLRGVYDKLMSKSAVLFEVSDGADGLLMVSVSEDNGQLVASTAAVAGKIEGPPKTRLRAMRQTVQQIEQIARDAGCVAHRIAGRDYARLFPEYSPCGGSLNAIEKVL